MIFQGAFKRKPIQIHNIPIEAVKSPHFHTVHNPTAAISPGIAYEVGTMYLDTKYQDTKACMAIFRHIDDQM